MNKHINSTYFSLTINLFRYTIKNKLTQNTFFIEHKIKMK